ncbi:MAG TPA: hypothetical protein ENI07_15610 [Desulfobacterales bacterium]|nr:hypothetical protein [Desulfobacterales bacterium]
MMKTIALIILVSLFFAWTLVGAENLLYEGDDFGKSIDIEALYQEAFELGIRMGWLAIRDRVTCDVEGYITTIHIGEIEEIIKGVKVLREKWRINNEMPEMQRK